MADDLKQRGGQDRKRINVNQPHELRDWATKFGVPPGVVRQAVGTVGDQADKVEKFIKHGASKRSPAPR